MRILSLMMVAAIALNQSAFCFESEPRSEAATSDSVPAEKPSNFVKIRSEKLTRLWLRHPISKQSRPLVLMFTLRKNGAIAANSIETYNSSGDSALDQYAVDVLRKSSPFTMTEAEKLSIASRSFCCLARFDPENNDVFINGLFYLPLRFYLDEVERDIGLVLRSSNAEDERPVTGTFFIRADGSVSDVRVNKPALSPESNENTINAIKKSAPYNPLPPASPDRIKIDFAFSPIPLQSDQSNKVWTQAKLTTASLKPPFDWQVLDSRRAKKKETLNENENENEKSEPNAEATQIASTRLAKFWTNRPENLNGKDVVLAFNLFENGQLSKDQNQPNVRIHRTSGQKEINKIAINALLRARPYRLTEYQKISLRKANYQCLAKFALADNSVRIIVRPENTVDEGGKAIMRDVQQKISRCWYAPVKDSGSLVKCAFTITADGKVKNIYVIKSELGQSPQFQRLQKERSANQVMAEEAAVKAIEDSAPFSPLPEWYPDEISIEFTFTSNFRPRLLSKDAPWTKREKIRLASNPIPPYLIAYTESVKARILQTWRTKASTKDVSEKISFDIEKNGQVKNISLDVVTGDNGADRSVIEAVEAAAPFNPLPAEAGTAYRITLVLDANQSGTKKRAK
ncbi:MAG: energy transducer TonB [Cyanobacteria bacterium REEB67]|nr:energy transducer TonB [Cyanobacteria bacterium REEB67]